MNPTTGETTPSGVVRRTDPHPALTSQRDKETTTMTSYEYNLNRLTNTPGEVIAEALAANYGIETLRATAATLDVAIDSVLWRYGTRWEHTVAVLTGLADVFNLAIDLHDDTTTEGA